MKVKSFFLSVIILFALLATLAGCGSTKPKIALMLARGGLGDKAFNDSANDGLQKAARELGVDVMTFDYQQDTQEENMRKVAQQKYDLIIGLGSENSAAITAVSKEFPESKFALIDAAADGANITSVTFSELDGDFLAGALAALLSENNKIAYLGGADVLVIRRIQYGFEQGVKYVNPNAEVLVKYIAGKDDFSGFAKPGEATAISKQLYADGVEYHLCGSRRISSWRDRCCQIGGKIYYYDRQRSALYRSSSCGDESHEEYESGSFHVG